ncbi:MAG: hypothetical protein IJY19_06360 [Ruminococcus sp.]|nr:hypothetical protein [Ruminococcus sp.]
MLEEPIRVYNFSVEDNHTYFVGDNSVCVHNKCGLTAKDLISNINKVSYNDDDLAKVALDFRRKKRITNPQRNVCVVRYKDLNDNIVTEIFVSKNGMHSEELAISFLEDNNISGDRVEKLFTEREPCVLTETNNQHNCAKKLMEYMPNSEITYAIDYLSDEHNRREREKSRQKTQAKHRNKNTLE